MTTRHDCMHSKCCPKLGSGPIHTTLSHHDYSTRNLITLHCHISNLRFWFHSYNSKLQNGVKAVKH